MAGFRIRESALGFGDDVSGRTTAVSGTAVIAEGRVARAAFRIDLTAITAMASRRRENQDTQLRLTKIDHLPSSTTISAHATIFHGANDNDTG